MAKTKQNKTDTQTKETFVNSEEPMKLTPQQTRLLHVLMDEKYFNANISERCRAAEIDRTTYYKAMSVPKFREAVQNKALEMVVQDVPAVFAAALKNAKNGTPTGHADRKLIFQMLGVDTESQREGIESTLGALLKELSGLTKTLPKKDVKAKRPKNEDQRLHDGEGKQGLNPAIDISQVVKEEIKDNAFKH